MRLTHLACNGAPAIGVDLHPRLTVLVVDDATRPRVVAALDELLRAGASALSGSLVAGGNQAQFVVESSSGPVLTSAPMIVRAAEIDNVRATSAPEAAAVEHVETRHQQAVAELQQADAVRAEHEHVIDELRQRRVAAMQSLERVDAPGGPEHDDCRRQLRSFVDELEVRLRAPSMDEHVRVQLLERGTLLAGDASRLGVCQPATVRGLLDALDGLHAPAPAPAAGAPPAPAPADRIMVAAHQIVADLDSGISAPGASASQNAANELACVETELREAHAVAEQLDRTAGAARSRALAAFAELEGMRRSGATGDGTATFAGALRARLARRAPASWVGVAPIVVDDVLAACPLTELDAARAVLVDAAQRSQVIYLSDDQGVISWAGALDPLTAGVVHP